MTTEDELRSEGWEKQTTYDEPRLSEMAAAYEELGLEVCTRPLDPARAPGCTACMAAEPERFRTIWTRPPPEPREPGGESRR